MSSKKRVTVFIIFYAFVGSVASYSIPPFVPLCRWNDPNINECMVNAIYEVVPHLFGGIPEMNLPPSDPMHFSYMSIKTGSSALDVHLEITDGIAYGLLGGYVKSFKTNLANGSFSSIVNFPKISIQGDYNIKGKVLRFEVNSTGRGDFNASGVHVEFEWSGNFHTIKDKVYLIFDKIVVKVQVQDMQINLRNLIEGNELLTETINQAINENIQSLKEDMNPLIEEIIGTLLLDYFNRVFKLFPVKQLYPDD